jgi:zinc D-Ala-D-Ala carboxypeptidase
MIRMALALCLALAVSGCFGPSGGDAYRYYAKSHGYYVANGGVDTSCMTPRLKTAIGQIERHFGRKAVVSSGYRSAFHNARVGGADNSYHTKCMAADIFVPGVPKGRLISYARKVERVGGLGCYPGRTFIHIDVRDRPRGWRQPVTFSGC